MNAATRNARPATEKQISFLKKLIDGKDLGDLNPETAIPDVLTTATASYWIDQLIALPWKPRAPKARVEVEAGFYRAEDGSIAKVQLNLAGTRKYAKRLVVEFGLTEEGREVADAEWVYESGLIGLIAREGWKALTLEEAEAFGKLYGICCICGRRLTNEESIERGIGPVCASKF